MPVSPRRCLRDRSRRRTQQGFSLIELMIVLLIIAILLGIAIPTYLGARDRAANRAAQITLRNATAAAVTVLTGNGYQPVSPQALDTADSQLSFGTASTSLQQVTVWDQNWAPGNQSVILGVRASTGYCFYQAFSSVSNTWYGVTTQPHASCPWNEGPGPEPLSANWSPLSWSKV